MIGDTRRHWLRNGLVMAQVAGSLIVLVAAGLFTRSLTNAEAVDLGYDPHQVLNVSLDPKLQGYDQAARGGFLPRVAEPRESAPRCRIGQLGILASLGLLQRRHQRGRRRAKPAQPADKPAPGAGFNCVTPDYFSTMRMKILRGRAFAEADTSTSPPVAIVNETMAERLWPHQRGAWAAISHRRLRGTI